MVKYRSFIRKYKLWLAIASFIFIGLPQYIDSVWSIYEKVNSMSGVGINITWLYVVTLPIGLAALFIIIWQSRKPLDNSNVAWEVYDNLVQAFRELTYTTIEVARVNIHARIEEERGKLPDERLDEMITLFLAAEAERARFGMNTLSDDAQYLLSLNNKRMRNHINKKYGSREVWKKI